MRIHSMTLISANSTITPPEHKTISTGLGESKLVLSLLLVALTLALYNPISHSGFLHFDDDHYVTNNSHIRGGVNRNTVSWAFTSLEQANWHPLTWLSHALDCQLFQLNPVGHHYTNLLFHALNALLLFLILQWFTAYTGRSLMVAALFAMHPLNVESVAWVAERKNVLSMLFFLLAIAAYGWYVRRPGVGRYFAVAALFAMGLMSKPMVITLPFVLLLLDYWPLDRVRFPLRLRLAGKLCLEKIPLFALSVISALVTMKAQRKGGAVMAAAENAHLLRFENAVLSYALYIKKAIWPSRLVALYPYPHAIPAWQVGTAALFLLAISWAALRSRKQPYLVVGWLWFLGTLIPMVGVIQVGNQSMADRYCYLSLIGLFVMIVWAAADWAAAHRLSPKYLAAAGLAILAGLSVVTHLQLRYWRDDYSLWEHALAASSNNYIAENSFGVALIRLGRREEAVRHFRASSALEPGDPGSHLNLGAFAQESGDYPLAAAHYQRVLELTSDAELRSYAFSNRGYIYYWQHDYARAQPDLESALQLNGTTPSVLLDLGLIAGKKNDWKQAVSYFARFSAVAPTDVGCLLLAHALDHNGRTAEAKLAYQEAARLSTNMNQAQQTANQIELNNVPFLLLEPSANRAPTNSP